MKCCRWSLTITIVFLTLCSGQSWAAGAKDSNKLRYYPGADGPEPIDDTIPPGEGPRFIIRTKQSWTTITPEYVKRIRSNPNHYILLDEEPGKEKLLRLLLNNPEKKLYYFEKVKGDEGWSRTWYLQDKWLQQAAEKWNQEGTQKYLIQQPLGGFGIAGQFARWIDFRDVGPWSCRLYQVAARMRGPDGKDFQLHINFTKQNRLFITHRMLSMLLRERTLFWHKVYVVKHGDHYTLEMWPAPEGYIILWPVDETTFVDIVTIGKYPKPVIEAYLSKYPSILKRDFQYDRNEWARNELDRGLARLRSGVKLVGLRYRSKFKSLLGGFNKFGVKFGHPAFPTLEQNKQKIQKTEAWAQKVRDKLTWNPETKLFVIGEKKAKPVPLVNGIKKKRWDTPKAPTKAAAGTAQGSQSQRKLRSTPCGCGLVTFIGTLLLLRFMLVGAGRSR